MADNTILSPGAGGDTIREVDKGGAKTQVTLLDIGGLGAESLFTGAVTQSGTWTVQQGASPWGVTVSGSVAVTGTFWQVTQPISAAALPLPTGAALEAGNLATIAGKDFATQTTLALVKAKTDNLDVLLSSRTKPADQQHAIVDSGHIITDTGSTTAVTGTVAVSVASLPLSTNAAQEAGGNLDAIVQVLRVSNALAQQALQRDLNAPGFVPMEMITFWGA